MPSNFQDDDTKTRKARGFDPTKANVNGRSIDDYEYRDEKVRKADDDSRRSSYETKHDIINDNNFLCYYFPSFSLFSIKISLLGPTLPETLFPLTLSNG